MLLRTGKWNTSLLDLLIGTLLAAGCLLFQNSSRLLISLASYDVGFRLEKGGKSYVGNVESIPDGAFYVSAGAPREICDLYADNDMLISNRSQLEGLRNGLYLGAGFIQAPGHRIRTLAVRCQDQKGFGGFTHTPVVSGYIWGVILQTWRQVTDLLIGPLSSFIIILSLGFRPRRSQEKSLQGSVRHVFEDWPYTVFGLVGFGYALSLAMYTRLLIPGLPASILHIALRNSFSLAVLLLFTNNLKSRNFLIGGQVLLLAYLLGLSAVAPEKAVAIYYWTVFYFPLSCTVASCELLLKDPRRKSEVFLRRILCAWTLTQVIDTILLWSNIGAYSGPSLIFLISASAFYLRYLERQETINVDLAVSKILTVIESNAPITSILKELTMITMKETNYGRCSAYVDGFCIGAVNTPGKSFYRVSQDGYKKDTSKDAVVSFTENRGALMEEAIRGGKPILKLGEKTGAWFMIIPIGMHATINLSDDRPKSSFLAYESLDIAQRIYLSLLSLERRLVDLGFLQGAALQKLRSKRGDGLWEEEFGALFIDINDYSQLADQYGDPFTSFVAGVYIPAFIKAVSQFAVSEHVAGDEIYFIITKDLIPPTVSLRQAILESLSLIDSFVYNEGANLCVGHGFQQLSVSIGVNIGVGTIISDSVSVRTSGKMVNHAKRLQEEAGKGGILISAESNLNIEKSNYSYGDEFFVRRKKQVILAKKMLRRKRPQHKLDIAS